MKELWSLFLTFAKGCCNNGTTTCTNHKAQCRKPHYKWHNKIDRCKGGFSNKVRYEKSVYNTVNRCKNHHNN